MELSAFDDYPFHQAPTPFATAATTDAHYNDGYFVAFYHEGWYFCTGMRLHPNVNVIDAWVSVAHGNRQSAIRASRTLHPRYDDLSVGPITYEILEPMKTIRVVVASDFGNMDIDVVFESQSPPFIEDRYQHFKFGAVVNDLIRYTQVCRASGQAKVKGESLKISNWHAMRDHSWGVRSSMGVPTGIRGVRSSGEERERRALRLWVPFEVESHCGFFNTHENSAGEAIDFEGRLDYADGRSVKLTAMRHELKYLAGTDRPCGGKIQLDGEDGETRHYELELVGTPADVQAGGYYGGWSDNLGPGIYRGDEVIEYDDYDVSPGPVKTGPPHVPVAQRYGPTEYPMRLIGSNGEAGMAHFEHTISGPYPRYGFN